MEMYTSVSRFILIANYAGRIISPIKSRCAVFRFRALSESDIRRFIRRIERGERLKVAEAATKAIIYLSEGDLRQVANLLQACAALGKQIDEEVVYEVASQARPGQVRQMLELALSGDFEGARRLLQHMLLVQGLAGQDVISTIHRQIYQLDLSERVKAQLIQKVGEFDYRLRMGSSELIQLEALLAQLLLHSRRS
jgi:replication factor C small subunit